MPHMGRFYFQVNCDPRNHQRFEKGDIVLVDPNAEISKGSMLLLEFPNKKLIVKEITTPPPRNLDKKIVGRVVELYIRP